MILPSAAIEESSFFKMAKQKKTAKKTRKQKGGNIDEQIYQLERMLIPNVVDFDSPDLRTSEEKKQEDEQRHYESKQSETDNMIRNAIHNWRSVKRSRAKLEQIEKRIAEREAENERREERKRQKERDRYFRNLQAFVESRRRPRSPDSKDDERRVRHRGSGVKKNRKV